jgi:hypothetical protein
MARQDLYPSQLALQLPVVAAPFLSLLGLQLEVLVEVFT